MDSVYLILFNILKLLIKFTPSFISYPFFKALSRLIYFFDKKHRKIAQVNLDLAYEDNISQKQKESIIKLSYENIMFSLIDFIKNQGATKEEILSKVTFKNEHIIQNVLDKNKNIIIITAHYGNWELLSLSIAARFTSISVVGRDLESEVMNKILTKNREQFDVELLSKTGAMKGMIKALKRDRPVGLLVDQNTKNEEGILIDFFGKKARHTPSAAILAKKFDAVIIPAFITTDDYKQYTVTFYDEINIKNSSDSQKDILECVQAQANITQEVIKRKPQGWFWQHQRWKNQYEHLYK